MTGRGRARGSPGGLGRGRAISNQQQSSDGSTLPPVRRPRGRPMTRTGALRSSSPSPLPGIHQEMLDEEMQIEREERGAAVADYHDMPQETGGIDQVELNTPEVSRQRQGEVTPPAGATPIASVTMLSWPSWRKHFFKNWHEDPSGRVCAQCKLCTDGHYFSGSKKAFSNFSLHIDSRHKDEWSKFHRPATETQPQQSRISTFATTTKMPSSRQRDLEMGLARVFAEANLPLNLLNLEAFKEWITVRTLL